MTELVIPILKKKNNRIKIRQNLGTRLFNVIGSILMILIGLVCIIPFIMILSGSFSSETVIASEGYGLLPRGLTLAAYKAVLTDPMVILRAYGVSFFVTGFGTVLGLFLVSMSGYVLSRPDYKFRNQLSLFVYFTTLFGGGMIPSYVVVASMLNLRNNIFAMILPGLMAPFNVFLMKNFLKSISQSFVESARIDGAGDFRIYWQIVLPLAKPALATIGLFMAMGYWNDWFSCSLYIQNTHLYSLPYLLYQIMQNAAQALPVGVVADAMPSETMKLATAMLTVGPIIFLYPFVQKYFVSGLVIGGVKG